MMTTRWMFVVAMLAAGGAQARPDDRHDERRDEQAQIQREVRGEDRGGQLRGEGRAAAEDDRRDLRQLEGQLRRYDEAIAARDFRTVRTLDAEVLALVDADIRENQQQGRQARIESTRERSRPARNARLDDARFFEKTAARESQLRSPLARLQGKMDPRSLSQKRTAMNQLLRLSVDQAARTRTARR